MLSDSRIKDNFSYNNFKDFTLKPDLSANKTFLKNAYGHEIQFYNDDTKKNQNRKRYFLIAGSAMFVVAGAILAALGSKKIDINSIKKGTQIVSKNAYDSITNFAMNFANLKDDLWDRFACFLSEKTPLKFVKEYGDKLTQNYRNVAQKSLSKRLYSSQKKLSDLAKENEDILKVLDLKEFDFDDINNQMSKKLKENRISQSVFSLKDGVRTMFERLTTPICDNLFSDIIDKHSNIIDIEKLKDLKASEELLKEAEKYNSLQSNELFPKLRDINCGSAPNDIVCAAIPILSFLSALIATDDEEKRNSIALNIGIPLIPTCIMPFVGLKFPVLNGFKGMMTGFATGQLVKQSVKLIDKKINGENELNKDVFDKNL